MKRYRLTAHADADLRDIHAYIGRRNEDAAYAFILDISSSFRRLVRFPELGIVRPDLHPNLRSIPFGKYVIFYKPTDTGVEIVRILHSAQELTKRKFKNS